MKKANEILIKILHFLFVSILIVNFQLCYSQQKDTTKTRSKNEKIPFKDRFYTGGDVGLLLGNMTYINISPILGFKATKRYSLGFGINYEYLSISGTNLNTSIYGGRFFNQYQILQNIFAHAEYALINIGIYDSFNQYERRWFGLPLIGGGLRQNIFGLSNLDLLVLYNLNDSYYLPYPNPIIRVSVNIGI